MVRDCAISLRPSGGALLLVLLFGAFASEAVAPDGQHVAAAYADQRGETETPGSSIGAGAADSTWKAHLAFMASGSGIWITSNAQYRTDDNGEPPTYGMRYWMGIAATTRHGCLWGEGGSREPTVFWSFFTTWDPARGQLLVQQAAPNGTIGIGHESPETGIAEQTFTRPDGVSWEVRHVTTVTPPDTIETRSFERAGGGAWQPRRSYQWVRQPAGTPAPC